MSDDNTYDRFDVVKREAVMIASGPFSQVKFAAYRVRDPDKAGEWSAIQFHATYDDTVMAVMGEQAARAFADFVARTVNGEIARLSDGAK